MLSLGKKNKGFVAIFTLYTTEPLQKQRITQLHASLPERYLSPYRKSCTSSPYYAWE